MFLFHFLVYFISFLYLQFYELVLLVMCVVAFSEVEPHDLLDDVLNSSVASSMNITPYVTPAKLIPEIELLSTPQETGLMGPVATTPDVTALQMRRKLNFNQGL